MSDLTSKQFDMLQLAVTADEHERKGIPFWASKRLKPEAKRAFRWLLRHGLIEYSYGNDSFVATSVGEAEYEHYYAVQHD